MLYGIAVIVVVAFIGLIVINMRAGRPANRAAQPEQTGPSAAEEPGPERARPPSRVVVNEAPQAADDRVAEDDPQLPSASREEQNRGTGAQRKFPAPSTTWEQNDDEYRQALRSFSGQTARSGNEGKEDSAAPGKDEAFREGLRSLGKNE